jgi:hypothetical protein
MGNMLTQRRRDAKKRVGEALEEAKPVDLTLAS